MKEIEAVCASEFTFDVAVANDNGDNAFCTNFCRPSNPVVLSKEHAGHIWMNRSAPQLATLCSVAGIASCSSHDNSKDYVLVLGWC